MFTDADSVLKAIFIIFVMTGFYTRSVKWT